jgi:hypothetical protein
MYKFCIDRGYCEMSLRRTVNFYEKPHALALTKIDPPSLNKIDPPT